jgi:hypothetical protein
MCEETAEKNERDEKKMLIKTTEAISLIECLIAKNRMPFYCIFILFFSRLSLLMAEERKSERESKYYNGSSSGRKKGGKLKFYGEFFS